MTSEKVSLFATSVQTPLVGGEDGIFTAPVQSVALPSKGVAYPTTSPLFRCESLDIKAMTASEENILSSRALLKKGTAITALLRSCITNKTVDPDEMLVGDRNAVLVAVRVSGYGAEYEAEV